MWNAKMNQTHVRKKINNGLMLTVAKASVYIDLMTAFAELTGNFPDVNAHAAGVIGSQFSDGIGMYAEHCNSKLFLTHLRILVKHN